MCRVLGGQRGHSRSSKDFRDCVIHMCPQSGWFCLRIFPDYTNSFYKIQDWQSALGSDFFPPFFHPADTTADQSSMCSVRLSTGQYLRYWAGWKNRALLGVINCPESNHFVHCDTFWCPQVTGMSRNTFWRRQWTMWIMHSQKFSQKLWGNFVSERVRGLALSQILRSFCVSHLERQCSAPAKWQYLYKIYIPCITKYSMSKLIHAAMPVQLLEMEMQKEKMWEKRSTKRSYRWGSEQWCWLPFDTGILHPQAQGKTRRSSHDKQELLPLIGREGFLQK